MPYSSIKSCVTNGKGSVIATTQVSLVISACRIDSPAFNSRINNMADTVLLCLEIAETVLPFP